MAYRPRPTESWDPRSWEDTRPVERTDQHEDAGILIEHCDVEVVEIDLGATLVERLWGVNGRKQWLAALAEAERTGEKMR